MPPQKIDAIVLGAGIIGVSAALHLQQRGRDVALVDRRGAGEETSYGNAGLIERSSIFQYAFPRDLLTILRYARNNSSDAYYHLSSLPVVAPWLLRYFLASSPQGVLDHARAALPLIENSLFEHEALIGPAGAEALLHRAGMIKCYRTPKGLANGLAEAERVRPYGVNLDVLTGAGLAALEPNLMERLEGAVHYRDPGTISDPGALTKSYAALFAARGGRCVTGDAKSLRQDRRDWAVETAEGPIVAPDVVVALGPWSDDIFRPLGYKIPLGVKRGYHLHFKPAGNAVLNRPVLDAEGGYLLAPMTLGIRLTTGAEFARRDAPATPVQIARTEPKARKLFPLAEQVEAKPWMGARPCLPDMLPIIGQAPNHRGLWFDFGHQHHGFTLGPVSGRLLAEMIVGDTPFTDPAPYRADRFRRARGPRAL